MEHHKFSVTASGPGATQILQATAGYIRFDSISAGDAYPTIEVRSLVGDRFLLKPGTDARLRDERSYFTIHNYDAQSTITGVLQIGSKEEKVEADRISGEVSIAGTVPVSVAAVLNQRDYGDDYGVAFSSSSATLPLNVLAAASNTAGVRVVRANRYDVVTGPGQSMTALLAKATAPASVTDGDVLAFGGALYASAGLPEHTGLLQLNRPLLVASGKRLDFYQNTVITFCKSSVLYTLLP
jgi:hypothetical protein